MSMVGFPLLLIPLAIYNIIAFLMPGVSFAEPLVKLKLVSGAEWPITLSDVMLALGILLLLHEVIKGARPGGKYLTDHFLSLIAFAGSAAEFVLWPKFGTSTFFLLVLLAMVDFFSGIALRAQRPAKAKAAAGAAVARPDAKEQTKEPAPAPTHPRVEPAAPPPAEPEIPPAASVAESVLKGDPEPKASQASASASEPAPVAAEAPAPTPVAAHEPVPAATESEPSPIPSPDLQPGNGTSAPPDASKH
jgi:hypothetical protein